MSSYVILTVGVLFAVILDLWFILTQEHYKRLRNKYDNEQKAYKESDLRVAAREETIKDLYLDKIGELYQQKIAPRLNFKIIVELVLLVVWAMVISKPYLNMDVRVIPAGNEFNSAIQTHHLWTRAQECGWCAIWNGSVRGGYPAFVDVHGSALHPLVIVTTLLWGVVNGAKITLFLSFWLAGIAQWWLARELKVSTLARVFTAGIAISGGHITSRMELGAFGVVLSTAMVSLVFPAVLYVLRRRDNRSMVILGIVLASAILSGQGYIQVGLALMLPAFLVLIWREKLNFRLWEKLGQAVSIALLLAAPFLVPLAHFSSQIVKDSDPKFSFAQPMAYMPLNLIIQDPSYYRSNSLDKLPFPHLNANFIGWIPVALAVIGTIRANSENRRKIIFMLTGIILIYLTASAILLKWIALIYPSIGGVRHSSQISGLAIPLLLGISAYGVDGIKSMVMPILQKNRLIKYELWIFWILILPLMAIGLLKTYQFSVYWIYTVRVEPRIDELISSLKTPSLTWVNPPFGEHVYIQPAVEAGLKISPGWMTWKWRDREIPFASLEANRAGPPSENSVQINFVDGIPIYEQRESPYAAVYVGESVFYPCFASGIGGQIRVECDAPQGGQLIVKENMWSGWQAHQDEQRIELMDDSQYLQVPASAGRHIYQFNYQPWDVPVGIILSIAGILICLWVWRYPPTNKCKPVKKSTNNATDKESIMKAQSEPSILDRVKNNVKVRLHSRTIAEWALLACIALLITQPYLDFNEKVIPAGNEFGSVIQNHHLWTRAQECGWCALWNGSINGGYPAFVDLHGSALHPIVIITTLLWGVINGTKVALFLSFWLAGIAQWWLAKELRVSTLARLWTACIAITSGHLTSRMELGTFGLVLSTAMTSFFFAALVYVIRCRNSKSVVLLAIVLASSIVSGQGYIQIGLLLMSPAILILIWKDRVNPQLWKPFIQSIVLAILLASPFLVPFLNFSSQFTKWQDPDFQTAQPLAYLPFNLVIDNQEYYLNQILQKSPYPYMNAHFIGWIPVILAILGLGAIKSENRRYILFLASGIILIFLAASATSLRWIAHIYPGIAGVRHPAIISGLAIPLIFGLSAYGLDKIKNIKWPSVWVSTDENMPNKAFSLSIKWILIIPLLLLAFKQTYDFSKNWIYTIKREENIYAMVTALQTPNLAWVNTPFGEHIYMEPAIKANLKLSPGILAWGWVNREIPVPSLEALRSEVPPDNPVQVKVVDGISIYFREWEHYASVISGNQITPCEATGMGGRISVKCDVPSDGILTLQENMWTGWTAWQDGQPIEMLNDSFLQVKASAGKHTYQFEYRPWDVPLGIALFVLGSILCAFMLFKKTRMEQF